MPIDTSNRRTQAVIGAVVVVIVAIVLVVVLTSSSTTSKKSSAAPAPRGYTNVTTVTTLPPNVPHPATPRPKTLPPKIYATGACGNAMNTIRALMTKYPSGLALNAAGSAALTADLKVLNTSCTPALAKAFQIQELSPWLNYAVGPTATTTTGAPTTTSPATSTTKASTTTSKPATKSTTTTKPVTSTTK